jgi:hypothetical protein
MPRIVLIQSVFKVNRSAANKKRPEALLPRAFAGKGIVAYGRACGVSNVLNEQLICGAVPTLP